MNGGAAPRPSLRETRNILNRKSCKATLAESKNKDMELKMRTTGPLQAHVACFSFCFYFGLCFKATTPVSSTVALFCPSPKAWMFTKGWIVPPLIAENRLLSDSSVLHCCCCHVGLFHWNKSVNKGLCIIASLKLLWNCLKLLKTSLSETVTIHK